MSDHEVSVILTVLNEGKSIGALMEALLNQTYHPAEIVIIDGGSIDNTVEILREYCKKDERIKFFVEPGVNIAGGRNLAIKRSRCTIIAVTDGGCRPAPNWLEEIVRPLFEDKTTGAVAGAFEINWRTRFEYFSGFLCLPKDNEDEERRLFYGRSSAFLREAWERAGGYPEWLYTAEDTLFALKVRQLGYRVAYASRSIVSWRPRPTLRKLARMFFLYGRGNGRINRGSIEGTLYWLRNHSLWVVSLAGGFIFPWLWILTLLVLGWLYVTMVLPVLREVRHTTDNLWREIYVPLIVMTRNISNNLGYLVGHWEYYCKPQFQDKLNEYLTAPPL